MATMKEVAKRAGVSIGTVSHVLSGTVPVSRKRRERVLTAVRNLRYHPNHIARSLKVRSTRTLGMIISDITNPFFSQMVRGAEDAALERGYLLLTFNSDDREDREHQVLAVLRRRRVDGVLLVVAPSVKPPSHIRGALAGGIPIVCLDRLPPGIRTDSVTVDNVEGARHCIDHLIGLGHRRIGIITGSLSLQTARERLEGYRRALSLARIPVDSSLILEGDYRAESGYRLARRLLAGRSRPTALFISNSMMGLGVLKALEEIGFECPRDIALATFDDLPLTEAFRPHLTAVAQPAYLIGYQGAELLIQRIDSKKPRGRPVQIRLPTKLIVRESTGGSSGTLSSR